MTETNRLRDKQVCVPMTETERERLREISRVTGTPQAVLLRDGGLTEAERKLWEHRRRLGMV